jgi:hypothetical protein
MMVHRFIVPAAYSLLPPEMQSDKATAMLLAIGLQESKFQHRRQLGNGPARGFWQFEMGGGVKGVSTHADVRDHLEQCLEAMRYSHDLENYRATHALIEHHDVLACVCARLLLWTLPDALPDVDQADLGWQQYLDGWRPGKPHPDTWDDNYSRAWMIVQNP